MIRKADENDIEQIANIYDAIHTEEEKGKMHVGWKRDVYPVRQTAQAAVECGEMFVELQNERIVASGIINKKQVSEYADCTWKYPAEANEVMVLHTLVVHPNANGNGYAKEFIQFYEKYAKQEGCRCLRIDTQEKNLGARQMYARMGFEEAGVVHCAFQGISGVHLVCLEKKL